MDFTIQDLLFDGVKTGVVALITELLALFGSVIPNLEALVPLPIALQGLDIPPESIPVPVVSCKSYFSHT